MGIYQIKRANICYHDYYDDSCVMDFGNHCMLEIRWMFDNVWSRSNNDQGFICGCGTFAEPVRRFASALLETLFSEDTSCQLSKTSKNIEKLHLSSEIQWFRDRSNNDQGSICGCGTFAEPVRRSTSALLETSFWENTSCQLFKTSKIIQKLHLSSEIRYIKVTGVYGRWLTDIRKKRLYIYIYKGVFL